MSKFDLITTEEILEELVSRFDSMIFYGLRKGVGSLPDKAEGTFKYSGVVDELLGLCERLKFIIYHEQNQGGQDE